MKIQRNLINQFSYNTDKHPESHGDERAGMNTGLHFYGNNGGFQIQRNTAFTEVDRSKDAITDSKGNVVAYYKHNVSDFDWKPSEINNIAKADKDNVDKDIWHDIEKLFSCKRNMVQTMRTGEIPDIHISPDMPIFDVLPYLLGHIPIFYSLKGVKPWVVIGNKGKISTRVYLLMIITEVVLTCITSHGEVLVSNPFNIIIWDNKRYLYDEHGEDLFGNLGKWLQDEGDK